MGKRRNTAKTGDKALYANRDEPGSSAVLKNNDPMYTDADRFHNQDDEDFMRVDQDGNHSEDQDDGISRQQHVMDLGVGGDSTDESSNHGDSSSDEEEVGKKDDANPQDDLDAPKQKYREEELSSDDSEDDEEMEQETDPRNWGTKKSAYYHGDTADLEIGQNEEDAFVEEEAAREVQGSRFVEMDDDDFQLSAGEDDDEDVKEEPTEDNLSAARDTSKLAMKGKRKLLKNQHPELLPVVSYFGDVSKELEETTQVATKALTQASDAAENVGASLQGQQYLLTKSLLQSAMALNTAMYLLLKSSDEIDDGEHTNIDGHPVMAQLKKCNSTMQKLDDHVHKGNKDVSEQLENLVKAARLVMQAEGDESSDEEVEESDEDDSEEMGDMHSNVSAVDHDLGDDLVPSNTPGSSKNNDAERERVLDEARFGLRQHEVNRPKQKGGGKRKPSSVGDFGDLDENEVGAKSFASMINSIEQRSQTLSKKRRPAPLAEALDDPADDDRVAEGLKMMEEAMGKLSDSENEGEGNAVDKKPKSVNEVKDDSLDFYNAMAKKSNQKKALKKSLYQVAPKFPRTENEVDGERAISRVIMKNRGLVAHKAKINRNPRVKKREQYRKALIRRKGAVREVRTEEGHKYGGEETGIKSGISRSRKLKS